MAFSVHKSQRELVSVFWYVVLLANNWKASISRSLWRIKCLFNIGTVHQGILSVSHQIIQLFTGSTKWHMDPWFQHAHLYLFIYYKSALWFFLNFLLLLSCFGSALIKKQFVFCHSTFHGRLLNLHIFTTLISRLMSLCFTVYPSRHWLVQEGVIKKGLIGSWIGWYIYRHLPENKLHCGSLFQNLESELQYI